MASMTSQNVGGVQQQTLNPSHDRWARFTQALKTSAAGGSREMKLLLDLSGIPRHQRLPVDFLSGQRALQEQSGVYSSCGSSSEEEDATIGLRYGKTVHLTEKEYQDERWRRNRLRSLFLHTQEAPLSEGSPEELFGRLQLQRELQKQQDEVLGAGAIQNSVFDSPPEDAEEKTLDAMTIAYRWMMKALTGEKEEEEELREEDRRRRRLKRRRLNLRQERERLQWAASEYARKVDISSESSEVDESLEGDEAKRTTRLLTSVRKNPIRLKKITRRARTKSGHAKSSTRTNEFAPYSDKQAQSRTAPCGKNMYLSVYKSLDYIPSPEYRKSNGYGDLFEFITSVGREKERSIQEVMETFAKEDIHHFRFQALGPHKAAPDNICDKVSGPISGEQFLTMRERENLKLCKQRRRDALVVAMKRLQEVSARHKQSNESASKSITTDILPNSPAVERRASSDDKDTLEMEIDLGSQNGSPARKSSRDGEEIMLLSESITMSEDGGEIRGPLDEELTLVHDGDHGDDGTRLSHDNAHVGFHQSGGVPRQKDDVAGHLAHVADEDMQLMKMQREILRDWARSRARERTKAQYERLTGASNSEDILTSPHSQRISPPSLLLSRLEEAARRRRQAKESALVVSSSAHENKSPDSEDMKVEGGSSPIPEKLKAFWTEYIVASLQSPKPEAQGTDRKSTVKISVPNLSLFVHGQRVISQRQERLNRSKLLAVSCARAVRDKYKPSIRHSAPSDAVTRCRRVFKQAIGTVRKIEAEMLAVEVEERRKEAEQQRAAERSRIEEDLGQKQEEEKCRLRQMREYLLTEMSLLGDLAFERRVAKPGANPHLEELPARSPADTEDATVPDSESLPASLSSPASSSASSALAVAKGTSAEKDIAARDDEKGIAATLNATEDFSDNKFSKESIMDAGDLLAPAETATDDGRAEEEIKFQTGNHDALGGSGTVVQSKEAEGQKVVSEAEAASVAMNSAEKCYDAQCKAILKWDDSWSKLYRRALGKDGNRVEVDGQLVDESEVADLAQAIKNPFAYVEEVDGLKSGNPYSDPEAWSWLEGPSETDNVEQEGQVLNLSPSFFAIKEANPLASLAISRSRRRSSNSLRKGLISSTRSLTQGEDAMQVDENAGENNDDGLVSAFEDGNHKRDEEDESYILQLQDLRERGLNACIVSPDIQASHQLLVQYFEHLAFAKDLWGIFLVIANEADLEEWETTIPKLIPEFRVMPYWGVSRDRAALRTWWNSRQLYTADANFHVVLTSYELVAEDLSYFSSLMWQCVILDRPLPLLLSMASEGSRKSSASSANPPAPVALWTKLLGLRCRQRIMYLSDVTVESQDGEGKELEREHMKSGSLTQLPISRLSSDTETKGLVWARTLDIRLLVHFLMPTLFSTKERVLAWAFPGFDKDQIMQLFSCLSPLILQRATDICGVYVRLVPKLLEDQDVAVKEFIASKYDPDHKSRRKSIAGTESTGSGALGINTAGSAPQGRGKKPADSSVSNAEGPSAPGSTVKAAKASGGGGKAARKRIVRCGKCDGCMAEDCMVCSHCRDMKKYGGPGLRKQSCKKRKCINPTVIMLKGGKEVSMNGDDQGNDSETESENNLSDSSRQKVHADISQVKLEKDFATKLPDETISFKRDSELTGLSHSAETSHSLPAIETPKPSKSVSRKRKAPVDTEDEEGTTVNSKMNEAEEGDKKKRRKSKKRKEGDKDDKKKSKKRKEKDKKKKKKKKKSKMEHSESKKKLSVATPKLKVTQGSTAKSHKANSYDSSSSDSDASESSLVRAGRGSTLYASPSPLAKMSKQSASSSAKEMKKRGRRPTKPNTLGDDVSSFMSPIITQNLGRADSTMSSSASKGIGLEEPGTGGGKVKKRTMRCGKCAGCLAEDCMQCLHCRDMKKYGGPGLRKQGCKRRKCISPIVVILGQEGGAHRASAHATGGDDFSLGGDDDDESVIRGRKLSRGTGDSPARRGRGGRGSRGGRGGRRKAPPSPGGETVGDFGYDRLMPGSGRGRGRGGRRRGASSFGGGSVERKPHSGATKLSSIPQSGARRSRREMEQKRTMRCGKCAGCLAGDCMVCSHCRDMKKYGGPGLRKQSCKNRKCINPVVVMLNASKPGYGARISVSTGSGMKSIGGLNRQSSGRGRGKVGVAKGFPSSRHSMSKTVTLEELLLKSGLLKMLEKERREVEEEVARLENEVANSMTMQQSTNDPTQSTVQAQLSEGTAQNDSMSSDARNHRPSPRAAHSSSDSSSSSDDDTSSGDESSVAAGLATKKAGAGTSFASTQASPSLSSRPSPSDMRSLLHPTTSATASSQMAVSPAPPAIIPVIIPESQANTVNSHYNDPAFGGSQGSHNDEDSLLQKKKRIIALKEKLVEIGQRAEREKLRQMEIARKRDRGSSFDDQSGAGAQGGMLLPSTCPHCFAMFTSPHQVGSHVRLYHSDLTPESLTQGLPIKRKSHTDKLPSWHVPRSVPRLLRNVRALLAQHRKDAWEHPDSFRPPVAYAKLEGPDILHYMQRPRIFLGRMSGVNEKVFHKYGVPALPGASAGSVDCHLGFDSQISHHHAVIAWNVRRQYYEIRCLSRDMDILVDGTRITYWSTPVRLQSRALIVIGSKCFFFLLPRPPLPGEVAPTKLTTNPQITSSSTVRAWMNDSLKRRRAAIEYNLLLGKEFAAQWLKRRRLDYDSDVSEDDEVY